MSLMATFSDRTRLDNIDSISSFDSDAHFSEI